MQEDFHLQGNLIDQKCILKLNNRVQICDSFIRVEWSKWSLQYLGHGFWIEASWEQGFLAAIGIFLLPSPIM